MRKSNINNWETFIIISFILSITITITTVIMFFHLNSSIEQELKSLFSWLGFSSMSVLPTMAGIFGKLKSDKKEAIIEAKENKESIEKLRKINLKNAKNMSNLKGKMNILKHLDLSNIQKPFRPILENIIEELLDDDDEDFNEAIVDHLDK